MRRYEKKLKIIVEWKSEVKRCNISERQWTTMSEIECRGVGEGEESQGPEIDQVCERWDGGGCGVTG